MRLNKPYSIAVAWGLLHGINDWVAGYMITSFSLEHSIGSTSFALIIYTIIGFGGQLPVGMWLDKHKNPNPFINISILFLLAAVICYWINDLSGIIIAGLSSAFLHVTGGSICLNSNGNKAGPLGVFTAPGVLGLTLGIASGSFSSWILSFALIAVPLILLVFRIRLSVNSNQKIPVQLTNSAHKLIEGHDWIMIGILLTVALRSLLYEVISLLAHNWQDGLLTLGISAFAGKIIGGYLADKVGWKLWIYITLPLAFIFLQFGQSNLLMLGFGISCLQSSVPISIILMRRSMPDFPATSVAFTLGTAIAIAALFLFIIDVKKIQESWFTNAGLLISTIIVGLILLLTFKKRKRPSLNERI